MFLSATNPIRSKSCRLNWLRFICTESLFSLSFGMCRNVNVFTYLGQAGRQADREGEVGWVGSWYRIFDIRLLPSLPSSLFVSSLLGFWLLVRSYLEVLLPKRNDVVGRDGLDLLFETRFVVELHEVVRVEGDEIFVLESLADLHNTVWCLEDWLVVSLLLYSDVWHILVHEHAQLRVHQLHEIVKLRLQVQTIRVPNYRGAH